MFFFYCIVFNCVCLLLHAIYLFSKITSNGNISKYDNEGQQKKLKIDRSAQRAETWFVFNVILMLTLILTTTKTNANQINYSYFVTVKQKTKFTTRSAANSAKSGCFLMSTNCGKSWRIAGSKNKVGFFRCFLWIATIFKLATLAMVWNSDESVVNSTKFHNHQRLIYFFQVWYAVLFLKKIKTKMKSFTAKKNLLLIV